MRGSEITKLLHRASQLAGVMDDQFEQICGSYKDFDPRYHTLSRMRSYIDERMNPKGSFEVFNYKPQETEMETATELMGFIDHLEDQFRRICGDKTDYELDDETHGIDCRYQTLMKLRDDVMERLEPDVIKIPPDYGRVPSRAESNKPAIAA